MAGETKRVGSPLSSASVAPAEPDPLAGSAAPGSNDDYAAIARADKPGEIGESGRVITSENAAELQTVPGYPSLSVAAYSKQFLGAKQGQTIRLQRALVAAGYLKKDEIQTLGDSFDHATRVALGWLLEDSVYGGYRPQDILGYRMRVKAGQKPGALKDADAMMGNEEQPEEVWRQQMNDEYIAAWRKPAPPGYLEQFRNMNSEEFGAYERAKIIWEQSGVAEEERESLSSALAQHLTQPRNAAAPPPAGQPPGGGA